MDNYNKFSNILNIKEKQKILFLLILMIFSASLEVLGIGMVIPIITLILSPDQILTNPNYQIFFDYLGNPSKNQTTIYFMFIFLFIYLIKNLFLGFFLWFKLETTKILKVNLSKRLFENYLRKPYEFFLLKNSAHILRNTTTESESAMNMLFAFVNLVAEILVFVFIVSFIIFIEPKGAITTISTLSIFIYIYYFFIKNKVFQWGKKRQYYQGQNIKNIQQSIGGIKEMKILGCEDQFIKIFENNFFPVMKYTQFNQMLSQSLKLWLELIAIFGLVLLIILSSVNNQLNPEIIGVIGVFAAAVFRLLPAAGRITTSIQELKFFKPSLDVIHKELQDENIAHNENLDYEKFNNEIKLININYTYPHSTINVLENINLVIKKGDYIGFIGTSGSGKTTLVDLILGLLELNEGSITIDGKSVGFNTKAWQRQIGYVPQSIYLIDESIKKNIAFGIEEHLIDKKKLNESIKNAQLEKFVSSLSEGLETILGERGVRLSGGQKQRIAIARALYNDPEILILDEATSALDIETEKEVIKSISSLQKKKTVLVISHRLSSVKDCNKIYVLEKGKIIKKGSPEDIL